ncbi:MAG: hypothetical protein ACREQ7_22540 [Candidatus Binatia bacterium]
MKRGIVHMVCGGLLALVIMVVPMNSRAQQTTTGQVDGFSVLGSVFLSVLHVPLKLATCVGTQAVAAIAYTATFGVAGNYDGGTNGKQIGEVASRSCSGAWFITPEQVSKDYR